MKFIIRAVVLLLIMDVLLIYMHYSQAQMADAKESAAPKYIQEIEVVNRLDALHIRHHFSGLSEERFEIIWPEAAVSRSCHVEDASSCSRLDDAETAFVEGAETSQSISYIIPKNGPMKSSRLFEETFAILRGNEVSSTIFHLTDETGSGGLWVNGLKQIGNKKMEHIDYSFFRGTGGVTDLYWQKNQVPLIYKGKALSVYGKGIDAKRLEDVDTTLSKIGMTHADIVIRKGNPTIQSERFTITETTDSDKLANLLLRNSMHTQYLIPQKERLLADLTASIISGKPTGSDRSRRIYTTLIEKLTAEELEKLGGMLLDLTGEKIDAAILDGLIGDVTGFRTSFLTKSVLDDGINHQFLIEDSREIRFEGKADPSIRIVLKDGKTFYPAKTVLNKMGYTFNTNEQSIYIENDKRKFRFPKKERFYVYNERKYDVVTIPFELLDGDFYFEEGAFQRLFLVSIEKTDDVLDIVPISTFIEEAVTK